jgi:hypothetical protein
MNNLNYNEKYSDLQKLEEYKVLDTYQKLMIMEMKIISESLNDISKSLKTEVLDINYKGGSYTQRLARTLQEIATKYKGY